MDVYACNYAQIRTYICFVELSLTKPKPKLIYLSNPFKVSLLGVHHSHLLQRTFVGNYFGGSEGDVKICLILLTWLISATYKCQTKTQLTQHNPNKGPPNHFWGFQINNLIIIIMKIINQPVLGFPILRNPEMVVPPRIIKPIP